MSPGKRRYIERRLAALVERMGWMRHHINKPDTPEWMVSEWPELETKAAALRAAAHIRRAIDRGHSEV